MSNDNVLDDTYTIRPSGRHLITIGRDLIQNPHAAIIELVKNAYDADASSVDVVFRSNAQANTYTTIIKDTGHGMTEKVVIEKWLVPSTDDKKERKISPQKKRTMQGRKGIGRYAATILGDDLLLETTDTQGVTTTIYLEWANFENAAYLDEVEILVESKLTGLPSGTTLTINGSISESEWTIQNFKNLRNELRKLRPSVPVDMVVGSEEKSSTIHSEDSFTINLVCHDFLEQNTNEIIEPFSLVELYDYCIKGHVSEYGEGTLFYTLNKHANATTEKIEFDFGSPTHCGSLVFDIRVYDRDSKSIDGLIQRGLMNSDGSYIGKSEARQLLNDNNGIGVYRNGFRIRPLGDPDFDWLELNKKRVQNPSVRVGGDQVIGFVLIESEEYSGLIEKSARDGLKDNEAFEQLKIITNKILAELETRRRLYRQGFDSSKGELKIEKELERLYSFDDLKKKIQEHLKGEYLSPTISNKIIESIDADAERKNKDADALRQAIAVYQGQATLGKIIQVVIHEGRRPLNYFVNNVPFIEDYAEDFKLNKSDDDLNKIIDIAGKLKNNAKNFSDMFKRLDPLASGSRNKPRKFKLENEIKSAVSIFNTEMSDHQIELKMSGFNDIEFEGFPQDVHSLFVNLLDNSLYWLLEKKSPQKSISIECNLNRQGTIDYIDFRDSGPGIDSALIESGIIFEPNFTTKPDGMGIGLTIAGEVAERLGFNLQALESTFGAYFRLNKKTVN